MVFRIYGGAHLDERFLLEFAFVDLGNFLVNSSVRSVNLSADGYSLTGIGVLGPEDENFDFLVKMGMFKWDLNASVNTGLTESFDGTDLTYGLGARFRINEKVALRIEWENYLDLGDPAITGQSDVRMFSFGAMFFLD